MGFWDLLSFWKRGSKKKQHAVEAINSVELQNETLKRTGFGRKYEAGGSVDQLPNAQGEFGRVPTNPIPVNGSYGEVTYLSRLRVKATGAIVVFQRIGSCGSNEVCDNPVDGFEIVSLDGSFKDELFFDMYHDGQSSKVPEGYIMLEELAGLTGVPDRIKDFPNGIYEAVAQYSKRVFGSNLALPELRNISAGNGQTSKKKKKAGKSPYPVDRPAESSEYLQSWSLAGKYLQAKFDEYNQSLSDPHMGFCWLRTDIISPTFDSMNFRYKNRVFSVLLELVIPVAEDALMTKTTWKAKELQIKICKENDMIPCLFIVDVERMKPYKGGWNLSNTDTGEIVIPEDIADDSPRQVSSWELMNWGISIVMDDLRKKGNKILSFTDAPGIMPQLWFEDKDGDKCWVQVVVNKPMEVADLSGTSAEEYQGYVAGVMIQPVEGNVLYRSRPATIKYKGIEAIGN